MIKRLLTVDPKRRMTMTQALKHPWMQDQEAIKWAEKLMHPDSQTMPPPAVPVSFYLHCYPYEEQSHSVIIFML